MKGGVVGGEGGGGGMDNGDWADRLEYRAEGIKRRDVAVVVGDVGEAVGVCAEVEDRDGAGVGVDKLADDVVT